MARICNSAISGDGNWLAHGDRSGNIVLHDLKKRTFVAFPKKHGDRITALALSSQGKRLLSGDQDGLILLWDTETRKSTQQGKKHESKILDNEIHSLVFSADGKSFYSTCDDGVIKEWSIDSNEKEKRVLATRKDSGIATMALTPDGSRLAWSDGAAICSLDLTGDNKTLKKTQHLSPIRNLCFSLNGKSLAFSTESRTANIIDVKSGSLQFKRNGHDGEVTSMLFLAESDDILTEGSDGRCLHWKSDGVLIGTMAMNQAAFGTFPIVHSRRLIAKLDDKEQAVHFWSNPTLRYHSKISLGKKYPQAFTLLPDGKSVLVADDYVDGKAKSESIVRILDQESGKPVSKFETGLPEILKLQASPNRRKVFIRGQTKSIMIDLGTGKPDFVFEHLLSAGLQHAGEFTPDGKKLVVNYGLDDLWVIDAMSGKRIQPLYESSPVVRRIVTAMSVSPNGKLLAVALSDLGASRSHVDLWDMEKTTVVRTFRGGHEGRINSVCFSASSHFLGSGGADSTAVIWNLQRLPK
jgi:WD40 repeat protein